MTKDDATDYWSVVDEEATKAVWKKSGSKLTYKEWAAAELVNAASGRDTQLVFVDEEVERAQKEDKTPEEQSQKTEQPSDNVSKGGEAKQNDEPPADEIESNPEEKDVSQKSSANVANASGYDDNAEDSDTSAIDYSKLTLDDVDAKHFGLTDKQYQFCLEYMIDLNASQAMIRAGYSDKNVHVTGSQNLAKPSIVACLSALKQMQDKRIERMPNAHELAHSADAVKQRMAELAGVNVGKFVSIGKNGLPYYDFSELDPEKDFIGLTGMKVKQGTYIDYSGAEPVDIPFHEVEVKTDITKNLHALAKHHGLLKETVVLENDNDVDDIEMAKRIAFLLDKARREKKK